MTRHKKAQAVRRDARQADQGRQLHHSNFLTGIALQNSIEGSGCPVYGCNGKGMVLGYNANYGGGVDVKIGDHFFVNPERTSIPFGDASGDLSAGASDLSLQGLQPAFSRIVADNRLQGFGLERYLDRRQPVFLYLTRDEMPDRDLELLFLGVSDTSVQ